MKLDIRYLLCEVLNLVINGLPSIPLLSFASSSLFTVLNLVINGLPSIPKGFCPDLISFSLCFKPCYKWITFNTKEYIDTRL